MSTTPPTEGSAPFPSPTPPSTSRPSSPSISRTFGTPSPSDLKPNPHPYAIKTTSTALLSRSNSTPHNASRSTNTRHNYIPPPSSAGGSPALNGTPSKDSAKKDKDKERRGEYRGHRYSRSLSSDTPLSFPVTNPRPSSPEKSGAQNGIQPLPKPILRPKRATTVPHGTGSASSSVESLSSYHSFSGSQLTENGANGQGLFGSDSSGLTKDPLDDLPSNPKAWTPAQLSSYLTTALRMKGSGQLPTPVAKDIAAFVRSKRITGRVFLRFNDEDLEKMGMNRLWRNSLLHAARTLRQNVLKGRIWGFDNEGPLSPVSSDEESRQSAESLLTAATSLDTLETKTESPIEDPLPSPVSDHSSIWSASSDTDPESDALSHSQGEGGSGADRDGTPSRAPRSRVHGRFRTGKVKGMVETLERSGSESDASISEGDLDEEENQARKRKRKFLPLIPSGDAASSRSRGSGGVCDGLPQDSGSGMSPPKGLASYFDVSESDNVATSLSGKTRHSDSQGSMRRIRRREPTDEFLDEPSVEELLRSGGHPSGARAWEDDAAIGDTVKRVLPGEHSPPLPLPPSTSQTTSSQSALPTTGGTISLAPPASPPKHKSISKAQRHQMQSFSRATGAKAWEAEVDGEQLGSVRAHAHAHDRAGSGTSGSSGSGGMRKVTAKRIGDIFWGDGDKGDVAGEVPALSSSQVVEVIPEEVVPPPQQHARRRQDSGVQVDDWDFDASSPSSSLPPSYDEDKKRAELALAEEHRKAEAEREREMERQLVESIEATKAMAQTLKARIGEVEREVDELSRRVEEMETVSKSNVAPAQSSSSTAPSTPTSKELAPAPTPAPAPTSKSTILSLLQRYVLRNDASDPPSVRALPSYMLLVGIGMCAVVIRVVLRRVLTGTGTVRR